MFYLTKKINSDGLIENYEMISLNSSDDEELFLSFFNSEIAKIRKRVLADVLLIPKRIKINVEDLIIARIDEFLKNWLEERGKLIEEEIESVKQYYYPY